MPTVTCPTGLRGEIREWTVADEDVLAAAVAARDGKAPSVERVSDNAFAKMIVAAWRTVDPGPYVGMQALDVDRLFSVDYIYALLRARAESWGEEVEVTGDCGQGHRVSATVRIEQCTFEAPSPEAIEAVRRKSAVPFTLPRCNRTVHFLPLTNALEAEISRAVAALPADPATEALMARLASVDGFDAQTGVDAETEVPLRDWIKRLPSKEAMALRRAMAAADGSVDTEVHIGCKQDGTVAVGNVLASADFFAPGAGMTWSGRSSS